MRRLSYYPSRIADQANWLENYAAVVRTMGAALGLNAAQIAATVADANWCQHVLGAWLTTVRAFAASTTQAVDDVLTGSGASPVDLPGFTAPALLERVTAQPPGALRRIFELVGAIKRAPGYTETIGTGLGIVGTDDATTRPAPRFSADVEQGIENQCVRLVFNKYDHVAVLIEGCRGAGDWEFLAVDAESPYVDERPLVHPGQAEVREYRMRFWDEGTPNGEWTGIVVVTVGP